MNFDDFIRDLKFASEVLSNQGRHYQAVRVAEAIDLLTEYQKVLTVERLKRVLEAGKA